MKFFLERIFRGLPLKSVLQYASSSLICQSLRLSGVLLTTYLFPLHEFGLFAQITTCIALCGVVSGIGHHDAFIAYKGEDKQYYRFHFQTCLITGFVSLNLLYVVAPFFLGRESIILRYSTISAIIIVLDATLPFFVISAQKRFRFKFTGVIDIISVGSGLLFVVIGTRFSKTVEILLLAKIIESGMRLALFLTQAKLGEIGFCVNQDVFNYFWKTYFKNVPLRSIVDTLILKLDVIFLSHFVGNVELGLYERIQNFIQIPISISINLIDRVSLMTFSQLQDQSEKLYLALKSTLRFVCFASAISTIGITFVMPLGIPKILNTESVKSFITLWLCSIGISLIKPVAMAFGCFYLGLGKSYILLRQNLLLLLLMIINFSFLVPSKGIYGASVAISISYFFIVSYQSIGALKMFRSKGV